jgi:long-subunit acyl-CoA synthetase (AMP-forming)
MTREGSPTYEKVRELSYLPLSHIMSLYGNCFVSLLSGVHIYFADSNALQGTLIQFVK